MAKNKSFELNTREPKVKKPKPEKPPKAPKEKKQKAFKEKEFKVTKEKAPKIPKEKKVKPKKEKAFKFKETKQSVSAGVKQPKKVKINLKWLLISFVSIVLVASIATAIIIPVHRKNNEVIAITITSTPTDREFIIGEEFNCEGLSVVATRKNGKTFQVPISECTIRGFDSTKATTGQTIYVSYSGFTSTYYVSIKELPPDNEPVLLNVSLERLPTKLIFKLGERLSTSGGVILYEYSQGKAPKRVNLTNDVVYGYTSITTLGTHTLTVLIVENGIRYTMYYDITILPADSE